MRFGPVAPRYFRHPFHDPFPTPGVCARMDTFYMLKIIHAIPAFAPVGYLSGLLPPLCVGLFCLGLAAYWPEFPGFNERLGGYLAQVTAKLGRPGVMLVSARLVDHYDRSCAAGSGLRCTCV